MKPSRMRWTRHVERMGEIRNAYNCNRKLKGKSHLEDLNIDGR
jgi:hypothetical protein